MTVNKNHQVVPSCNQYRAIIRVTGRVVVFSSKGVPYLKLRLGSCDTDLVGFLNLETHEMPSDIGYLELVEISGVLCRTSTPNYLLLNQIHRASQIDRHQLPVLETLPLSCAANAHSLTTLVRSVRALQSAHLREFVRRTLERRDRLEIFLNAPASRRYHHSFPGGLLVHSLEVARSTVGMINLHEPDMSRELKETAFVGGLLHDIGKVFTLNASGKPTAAAQLAEHDAFTLEACASGLAYLGQRAPDLAMTLRHIWTCASPGARYGIPAAMTLARYVRDADGQNAMATNQRLAFGKRESGGFAKIGVNRYWQPGLYE